MVTMVAFGARGILVTLRSTLQRAGSFTRCSIMQNQRTRFIKRGHIFTHIPKVTLLCWGAVSASSSAARCQEATLPHKTMDRKSLVKVQVHKVIFFLRLSLRALVLLFKFGPLLLLSPFALMSTHCASYWLEALLWVTETSGPTFIKLGQWASTRRDIFSREFCEHFSRLHVKVRPHSWAHTKQFLRRAFGEGWRRLLVFDSKEPVGSGCVAQVYRGWARVAQVEDPSFQSIVEEMEREDMLEAWEIPGLGGVGGVLRQLWKGRKKEEEGNKERSYADQQPGEKSNEKERLIPVAIKVFVDNFVHGDLHPGNILVQCQKSLTDSSDAVSISGDHHGKTTLTDLLDTVVVSVRPDSCPLQLVLLDAGIVAQLSDHDLANFKAVFTAVVLRKVKLESNFASIVFAIMVLEGLGRSLDPTLDILDLAKPLLLKNCASLF
ncbi:hypothetical protein XENOCAPTIV_029256 [Xenoophorus captivus]|uniref:ABC1 atypical kinase-like domain-containing protein n=1 Tax=Xenoophorus captivus TaxID=1517983 RepID=A0ABV0S136_9TELE